MSLEVEIKYRIKDKESIEKLLSDFEYKEDFQKIDDYYKVGKKVFRIRNDREKSLLTYKEKSLSEDGFEVNKENEFEIQDITEFLGFIEYIGAKFYYSKEKNGKSYKRGDVNLELCSIFSGEKLIGDFLEIEVLNKEVEVAKKEIEEVVNILGLKEKDIEFRAYIDLIL